MHGTTSSGFGRTSLQQATNKDRQQERERKKEKKKLSQPLGVERDNGLVIVKVCLALLDNFLEARTLGGFLIPTFFHEASESFGSLLGNARAEVIVHHLDRYFQTCEI